MIKPMLFSTDMVRAILEDRKTVTRRVVKPQPDGRPVPMTKDSCWPGYFAIQGTEKVVRLPYQPGDILWVRETWAEMPYGFVYRVDGEEPEGWDQDDRWRPSIHMPKKAARLFLRVTGVRVERLQEIDDAGVVAEGLEIGCYFDELWNRTIKKRDLPAYGWDANPWVWVIEFERCDKPEGFV